MWRARHVASCAAAAWIGSRASATPSHPALKHGTPISHRTRYDENYVVNFDQRTRDPLWVIERLTKQRLDAEAEHPPGRRDAKYLEATDVPARLRSRLAHYKHSGYDRGHLAPAADHRGSKDAVQSTFYLDNMCPQDSLLNRGPWLRLEELCRSVARVADEVYVVSGPLFLPEREKDGLRMRNRVLGSPPSVTWVPSHFFKVVLAERGGVSYIGCFVLPNGKCDDDLSRWLVPLENLEAAAGLIPFPNTLTDDAARDALAAAEARWCPRGSGLGAGHGRENARIRHLCDLLPANALARKALPP